MYKNAPGFCSGLTHIAHHVIQRIWRSRAALTSLYGRLKPSILEFISNLCCGMQYPVKGSTRAALRTLEL